MERQKYTSEKTSVNIVAKVFNKVSLEEGHSVLDYGGGKYDKTKDFLVSKYNVNFEVFDPYNRTKEHNTEVLKGTYDYITCCNVLNVIYEDTVILDVLENIKQLHKGEKEIYVQVYEGNKTGVGKKTTKGYQRNQKAAEYLRYILETFGDTYVVTRKSNIFTIKKR